jgi:hypothetical protein
MEHSRRMGARGAFRATGLMVGLVGLACGAAAQQHVVVNFDDASLTPGVHYGGIFLDDGVRFTTCQSSNNIAVGGTITLTDLQPWFEVWQWGWAVSPPNYLLALNVGTHDMLLTFTVPVTSVGLDLDLYPFEVANVVRLVALQSSGGNNFTVLGYAEATDEVSIPPATHLSVDLGGTPFSAVLFQTLDELEGFDNLVFDTVGPIPPPSDEGPPGPPPAGSGGWEGGGSTPEPPLINENSSVPDISTGNENKAPESPTTGDQTSGVDNSASGGTGPSVDPINVNGSADNTSAADTSGGTSSGGGACGAPVAIILLCGMLMLRLRAGQGVGRD